MIKIASLLFVGAVLTTAPVWAMFYNFHLFPWGESKWWHFPEALTVFCVLLVPFTIGCVVINVALGIIQIWKGSK